MYGSVMRVFQRSDFEITLGRGIHPQFVPFRCRMAVHCVDNHVVRVRSPVGGCLCLLELPFKNPHKLGGLKE